MATITEDEMFDSQNGSFREEMSMEEMRQRAFEARKKALENVPIEPLSSESVSDLAEEVLQQFEEEEKQLKSLSEVEKRLEKANCYKALLQNPLFDSGSEIAEEVESEIRDFIQKRLRILMGIEQDLEAGSGIFTKEEVSALKHLAGRITQKAPLPQPQRALSEPKAPPRVNKTKVPSDAVQKPPSVVSSVEQQNSVPSKVKPIRKKKDEVEVVLPNGQTVKTTKSSQTGMKPRSIQELQEIADVAQAKAMTEVQAMSENPLISKIIGS